MARSLLKAIVCRRVDHIRAQLHCANDCGCVACVSFIVCVAEVGADADGRQQQVLLLTEMVSGSVIAKTFAITRCAFEGGVSF